MEHHNDTDKSRHALNVDYLLHELESAGKRATPQRYAVCQALVEHGGHPTVAEIFERVRDIFPMISQATVYNTIDTLEELGLIHRLDIANHEHTHYDLDQHAHVNLVCMQCGHITDVQTNVLDELLQQASQHTSYDIERSTGMVLYGTCPDCRNSNQYAAHHKHSMPCDRKTGHDATAHGTAEGPQRGRRRRRGKGSADTRRG
jgi:Fur family peroxide stress response transcriptional regulator